VDDRYYKGDADTPKSDQPRIIALSASVMTDLEKWRSASGAEPEDLVFAALRVRGRPNGPLLPIKYENLWQRDIKPRLAAVGLEWADFRCMRRTNSTLMRASGADAKVSADQRGHGLGVAMSEYTHSTLEQKLEAVGRLEEWLQVTPALHDGAPTVLPVRAERPQNTTEGR
jgi:integrase